MGFSLRSFALRSVVLGFGLGGAAPIGERKAAALLSPGPATLLRQSTEPFGLATNLLAGGGLHDKWRGVQRQLADELAQLAACESDRAGCASPEALRFLAIVDAGRARDGRARF
ncbi:hypothetical protein, partial [Pseudomonas syringae group sp. J309-1]|uniref:hypothetical protein n=1 Tax=Pseudomonas syringae group sp. J309-1 TaxID=3079588 RepID=UPI002907FB94